MGSSSGLVISWMPLSFLKHGHGFPEGGEEFLVVADEDGVGAHGGEEALGAGVEGVVEFDLAVFVLAVGDEDEEVDRGWPGAC